MSNRKWEEWWTKEAPANFRRFPASLAKSHETNKVIAREVAKIGGTVLDVGCATGITYEYIKPTGVKYTGFDFTEKFLTQARKLNPEIDVGHGSAFNLPFEDNSFDTSFCKAVLEHQHPKEYHLIVRELVRVAKKQVILAFFHRPRDTEIIRFVEEEQLYSNTYKKDDVIALIKSLNGFKKLEIVENLGSRKDAVYILDIKTDDRRHKK